jgi:RimJ/RimL family protein N-acetyltransferase
VGKGVRFGGGKSTNGYAFRELGLERLETETLAENSAMHRVLEKSGYQRIGRRRHRIYKGGEWHDAILFELVREEWLAAQEP